LFRSLAAPRASARVVTLVLLLGATGLATTNALASGPQLQAVVTHDGTLRPVAGVEVLAQLKNLQMSVVRTDAAGLDRLTRVAGVSGVALDDAVVLSGKDSGGKGAGGVLASEGLGGKAGKAGAGSGIRVAVIDTGVSDTEALNRASGRLVDGADSTNITDGQYGVAQTGGRYTDGYGHGTFMAGLIAGGPVAGTKGKAVGVAPGATVVVVRVARPDGSSSLSKVLGGLDWVEGHASTIDVANLSLSHQRPSATYGSDPLTNAVEQVRLAGINILVSSGNDASRVSDPGFDPWVITVGAADLADRSVAPFSGRGTIDGVVKPDVVANGVKVLGVLPAGSVLERSSATTQLDNGLFRGSGTSQATAVASGVVALFLDAHPGATTAQVKGSLRCNAKSLREAGDGEGLVQGTTSVCADAHGQALDGSGDATGEDDFAFDASSWGASSWGASSWGASSWGASSWGASSWGASSWGASSWGASSWGASSWGASSWGASSWGSFGWGDQS
jgi:serine protease AprX